MQYSYGAVTRREKEYPARRVELVKLLVLEMKKTVAVSMIFA